jgi:death on curing protein
VSPAEPLWLTPRDVLALHGMLLAAHGGAAGLRDAGLLESALARPRQQFTYARPDIFELAAAYAAAIVRNHPFVDGNKRTAFLAAFTFLGVNGYDLRASEPEVVQAVLQLTDKRMPEAKFAAWLRENCITQRVKPRACRSGQTKSKPKTKPNPRRRKA